MYKIEFTLKQHTPLIHFQHDQEGATLRATEVKPKLDRFIIEELTKLKGDEAKLRFRHCTEKKIKNGNHYIDNPDFRQEWLDLLQGLSNEHLAFDYKIKISPHGQSITYLKSNETRNGIQNPVYFANLGDSRPKHYSESQSIELIFNSFNRGVYNLFSEEFICKYFLFNNFGSRQSKGLGSYYPVKINSNKITTLPEKFLSKDDYYIEIESTEEFNIFSTIDFFWKWLKSGINYNGFYKDSILKLYISNNQTYKWEKRRVKELFLDLPANNDSKFFVRAYMGLADNFTYKWVPKRKRRTGEFYTPIDITINIECQNNDIQRNSAPYLFVPIKEGNKTKIFILYQPEFSSKLDNQRFNLTIKKVEPIKVIIGIDNTQHKPKEISKKIFPDLRNADSVIREAKAFLEGEQDKKLRQKAADLIEKAKDFIEFFNSKTLTDISQMKIINTPSRAPNLSDLLEFAYSHIGSTFDVKDFSGSNILKAKFLKNGK